MIPVTIRSVQFVVEKILYGLNNYEFIPLVSKSNEVIL